MEPDKTVQHSKPHFVSLARLCPLIEWSCKTRRCCFCCSERSAGPRQIPDELLGGPCHRSVPGQPGWWVPLIIDGVMNAPQAQLVALWPPASRHDGRNIFKNIEDDVKRERYKFRKTDVGTENSFMSPLLCVYVCGLGAFKVDV